MPGNFLFRSKHASLQLSVKINPHDVNTWRFAGFTSLPPPLLQMCHLQSIARGASWTNNACLAAKTAPKRRVDRM